MSVNIEMMAAHEFIGVEYLQVFSTDSILQAQEYEIYDLQPFFSSTLFSGAGFRLDVQRGVIRHELPR